MRAWIFVQWLHCCSPSAQSSARHVTDTQSTCADQMLESQSSGYSLAWCNPKHCNVAIWIPKRSPGFRGHWDDLVGLVDVFPSFPVGLVWLSPMPLNLRAFLLRSPISDTGSYEHRACLSLFAFPPFCLLPSHTSFHSMIHVLSPRESGGKFQAFPGAMGWDHVLRAERTRPVEQVPWVWEEDWEVKLGKIVQKED